MAAIADGAVLVGDVVRLLDDPARPAARACAMHRSTSGTSSAMSTTPSPCAPVVVEQRAVRVDAALDHEPARAALEHERLVVAVAGLGPGVGDQLHAERRLVVVRGLGGVADDEDHGVPAGHRERVGGRVVLDQPDELLELLGRELGGAPRRRSGRGWQQVAASVVMLRDTTAYGRQVAQYLPR